MGVAKECGGPEGAAPAAAPAKFVERPMEPVVSNGRGMRVLGFVPLGGLRTKPLHPKPDPPAAPAAAAVDPVLPPGAARGAAAAEAEEWADEDWAEDWAAAEDWPEEDEAWVEEAEAAEWGAGEPDEGGAAEEADWGNDASWPSTSQASRAPAKTHDGYKCVHGSYRSYYGYRGATASGLDARLERLTKHLGADCLRGKDVLDIGCNVGTVSLACAKDLGARRVVGMDIDAALVQTATDNRDALGLGEGGWANLPCEVHFRNEDFIECPLQRPPAEGAELFDCILCLSVTKWIHFARGDSGIRKLFRRVLQRLKPGGVFVLEPQEWRSYRKKRYMNRETNAIVAGIDLRPEAFDEYLVGLGFEHEATIAAPKEGPQGFQRSIRLFRKPAEEGGEEEAEVAKKPKSRKKSEAEVTAQPPRQRKQSEAEAAGSGREDRSEAKKGKKAARANGKEEPNGDDAVVTRDAGASTEGKAKRKKSKEQADECEEEEQETQQAVSRKKKKKAKPAQEADEHAEAPEHAPPQRKRSKR